MMDAKSLNSSDCSDYLNKIIWEARFSYLIIERLMPLSHGDMVHTVLDFQPSSTTRLEG